MREGTYCISQIQRLFAHTILTLFWQNSKNFNIADINYPGDPPIVMPPLNPPVGCEGKMTQRPDDTETVVKARLEVYKTHAVPVENYYREKNRLTDFEIKSGIPETMPRLLEVILGICRGMK